LSHIQYFLKTKKVSDSFIDYQTYNIKTWLNSYKNYIKNLDELIQYESKNHDTVEQIKKRGGWRFLFSRFNQVAPVKRAPLTSEEISLMKDFPIYRKFYKSLLLTQDLLFNLPTQVTSSIIKYNASPTSLSGLSHGTFGFLNKDHILYEIKSKLIGALQLFLPIRLPGKLKGQLLGIYEAQWINPKRTLSPKEKDFMIKSGHYQMYLNRQEFLLSKGHYHKLTQAFHVSKELIILANIYYSITHLMDLSHSKIIMSEEFSVQDLQEDEIQLIIDEAPFPHISLRIADRVYSFGQKNLNIIHIEEYFLASELSDIMRIRGYNDIAEKNNSISKAVGDTFSNNMPHSAVIITLKIDKEERLNLISYLESKSGQNYKNSTGVNDCATMIARALKMHTSIDISYLIDASPNQVAMSFSPNIAEGGIVKEKFQVTTQQHERKKFHTLRNAYLGYLESALFINFFIPMKTSRLYIDLTNNEEDLTYMSEEHKEEANALKLEYALELSQTFEVTSIDKLLVRYKNNEITKDKALRMANILRKRITQNIAIEREITEDRSAEYYYRFRSSFLIELMESKLEELNLHI
jgi:hypothetical protein